MIQNYSFRHCEPWPQLVAIGQRKAMQNGLDLDFDLDFDIDFLKQVEIEIAIQIEIGKECDYYLS
mgnify:CR=1 FL=1